MKNFAAAPCQLDVPDEELWGLKGSVLSAIVFHWPSVPQAQREPFLLRLFADPAASRYLNRLQNDLVLANRDLVPFVLLGRPGLVAEGATFETRLDAHLIGALFLDLDHGASAGECPILLWDMRRFGKVAGNVSSLKLRLAAGGVVSQVVRSMPLRVFHRQVDGHLHYFEIEVTGRHVKMHRGQFNSNGQKDWSTNQTREGDFASSAEAKARADDMVARHVRDGYLERSG